MRERHFAEDFDLIERRRDALEAFTSRLVSGLSMIAPLRSLGNSRYVSLRFRSSPSRSNTHSGRNPELSCTRLYSTDQSFYRSCSSARLFPTMISIMTAHLNKVGKVLPKQRVGSKPFVAGSFSIFHRRDFDKSRFDFVLSRNPKTATVSSRVKSVAALVRRLASYETI
jgi:hypothetical protein